jgi:hypothetical protein
LAFSATLSANPATFIPGNAISGIGGYLSGPTTGPYQGTLTDNANGTVSPNTIFFCLTGNQYYVPGPTGETGAVGPPSQQDWSLLPGAPASPPSIVQLEEAAFLVSMTLSAEIANKVTLYTNGSNVAVNTSQPGASLAGFEAALGPIQMAIWYVMHTLPPQISGWTYSDHPTSANIKDSATLQDVLAAQAGYANNTWANNNLQVFLTTSATGGQNFISVPTPEPGTMVLFGAGALLMGLGCVRRRLAKRQG